jgi:nucleotide-binding universal stress UspA family protein
MTAAVAAPTVIAALDGRAADRGVIAFATALAELLGASAAAVHVGDAGSTGAEAQAAAAGIPLRQVHGDVIATLAAAMRESEAVAMVLGARSTPGGGRPMGHTAARVAKQAHKPVLVVPPEVAGAVRLGKVLLALDTSRRDLGALIPLVRTLVERRCEITALHVHDERCVPPFEDQPAHSRDALISELKERYFSDVPLQLEVSSGYPIERVLLDWAASTGAEAIIVSWPEAPDAVEARLALGVLSLSTMPTLLVPAPASTL